MVERKSKFEGAAAPRAVGVGEEFAIVESGQVTGECESKAMGHAVGVPVRIERRKWFEDRWKPAGINASSSVGYGNRDV